MERRPETVGAVSGQIDIADLGQTLMHEHIVWLTPGIRESWPDTFDEDACIRIAEEKLGKLASRGIGTIVDLTPPDAGRDIHLLKKIQDTTTINIIPCTGMYFFLPAYWLFKSTDDMAAAFIKDISEGIQASDTKAGIIKLATDAQFSEGLAEKNEKCLRAGARAHRATGIPISTHTGPPTIGLEQQRIFLDEGVDLTHVVIGHVGDSTNTDLHKRLMDAGSTIEMDRFGMYTGITFAERVTTVAQLCMEGYADRMVLSHDHWCWHDWDMANVMPDVQWEKLAFTHISDEVLPALRKQGVTDKQIDQMLVENPRRILVASEPY